MKLSNEMKPINEIIQGQHPMKSQKLSQSTQNSISIYTDKLTVEGVSRQMIKLKKGFPSLPADYYDLLIERIKANNFTNNRLQDAIENLIDTCPYPTPAIANIISWDRRIKLYNHEDIVKMTDQYHNAFDLYQCIEIDGVKKFAHKNDIEKYNLK